jgi:methionyl-tRNA synthetase
VHKLGLSKTYPDDGGLFAQGAQAGEEIAAAYEDCDFARAMRTIMELADRANAYVDQQKPWTLNKDPSKQPELQDVCSVTINLFRQLVVYLSPVLPKLAEQTRALLGAPLAHWNESQTPQIGTPVAEFSHLMKRLDPKDIQAMIEDSKEQPAQNPLADLPPALQTDKAQATASPAAGQFADSGEPLANEPLAPECTIDDFAKVDLRVARVLAAEEIPEAKKLLKLTLSLGGDEQRTVFAGIKAAYKPEQLVGRLVIMVANLAPRQMKFGLSSGMVTAAGAGGVEVFLLGVDDGAKPGHRVH